MSGQMNRTFRSLLFVPGARPDRFEKAVGSGAGTIIIDLEDAVLPAGKDEARTAALAWLASRQSGVSAGLRINSPRTAAGCADIAALADSPQAPDFVMVPKAETPEDLEIVAQALGTQTLIAVVESGRSLSNVFAIAQKSDAGVLFGGADYSASLGAELSNWDSMLTARALIAAACGAAGVPAYDVPYLDVQDTNGLETTTRHAQALGFSGRACIHPAQVSVVNNVFSPSEAEIAEARALLEASQASGAGALLHKGKLVDRPVILAAQRTLDRART